VEEDGEKVFQEERCASCLGSMEDKTDLNATPRSGLIRKGGKEEISRIGVPKNQNGPAEKVGIGAPGITAYPKPLPSSSRWKIPKRYHEGGKKGNGLACWSEYS